MTKQKKILAVVVPAALLGALLAACSQSTAHPAPLGDCTSAYGCNRSLGVAVGDPSTAATPVTTDSGTGGDGGDTGAAITPTPDAATD